LITKISNQWRCHVISKI